MDEKVKERMNELLIHLADGIEKGGEFVSEQAPLVAQEMVTFGRVFHTTCIVISAVMAFVCAKCLVAFFNQLRTYRDQQKKFDESQFFYSFFTMMCGLASAGIAIPLFATKIAPAVMAWFAPRLYVLDYIKDLI